MLPHSFVSFRFTNDSFIAVEGKTACAAPRTRNGRITVRAMNRRGCARKVRSTRAQHGLLQASSFWTDRSAEEDYELFSPFRFLLKEENLLFAEEDGRAVGFLLWYPDFNQLASPGESFGLRHVLAYHAAHTVPRPRPGAQEAALQETAHRLLRQAAPLAPAAHKIAVRASHEKPASWRRSFAPSPKSSTCADSVTPREDSSSKKTCPASP
jgi:hypothetical protein